MSLLTEQLSSAAQNQIATQIAFFQAFSQSALNGLGKILALNLSIARQSVDHANQVTQDLLAMKEPKELFQYSQTHAKPQLEELMSYGRELVNISRDTRAGIWQAVTPGSFSISALITPTGVHIDTVQKPKTANGRQQSEKTISDVQQLPLLAELEMKPAKSVKTSVVKAKPVTTIEQKTAPVKKQQAARATAKKTSAAKADKPVSVSETPQPVPQATSAAPVEKPSTTVGKAAAQKDETSAAVEKKPVAKFPFPATSRLKAGDSAPTKIKAKPASRAKSSTATDAKKPVRQ